MKAQCRQHSRAISALGSDLAPRQLESTAPRLHTTISFTRALPPAGGMYKTVSTPAPGASCAKTIETVSIASSWVVTRDANYDRGNQDTGQETDDEVKHLDFGGQ